MHIRRPNSRSAVRHLIALIGVGALAVGAPAPASAHAELESTAPANGQLLTTAPEHIELNFAEDVDVSFGGIKVFGPDGERLETRPVHTQGGDVRLGIDSQAPGSYAVSWRVLSADGHPVRGAFVYDVEAHGSDAAKRSALAASRTSRGQSIAYGIARGMMLLGLLGVVGGAIFAVVVTQPGWRPRWMRTLVALLIAGTIVGYVLDAAIAGGFSIGQVLHWSVLREQASTVYGRAGLLRLALAVVAACLVPLLHGRSRHLALVSFLALGASQSLAGHAVATDPVWLRLPLDMLHTLAAAAWLGGLLQLRSAVGQPDSIRMVRRYSVLALGAVSVLLATGLYAAFTEIGMSAAGLLDTTYGRLVLGKSGLFVVLLGFGALNRQRVIPALQRNWANASRTLRRYVAAELAILVGVVALTAWLIGAVPARNQLQPGLFDQTVKLRDGGSLQLTIDPARAGRNAIHVYALTKDGQQDAAVSDLRVEAVNTKLGIEHLQLEVFPSGPGHFTTPAVTIPYAGNWRFETALKRGRFEQETVVFRARIAGR